MRIGVIGLGTIATAVVHAIAPDGHEITVSERSAANAALLAETYSNVSVATNQAVIDKSDTIFLGLTDEVYADALGLLTFREGQTVISMMANPPREEVERLVAPAILKARMLPYPSIATSSSQILVCGEVALVEELFGARHSLFRIEKEDDLKAWLCAQAVLSPALLMIKETTGWLADQGADATQAEQFLRELVGTSLLSGSCDPLLRALDTPGGFNQQLREALVGARMIEDLHRELTKMSTLGFG